MNRLINVKNGFSNSIGTYVSIGPVVLGNLSDDDNGRSVVYTAPHGEREFGYLRSWNDTYVFVKFNSGDTSASCRPNQLQFVKGE